MKFVVIFLSLLCVALAIESNFYAEESCSNVRGYCVLESECPHSVQKSHKHLCAHQQKDGAVCCKDFPSESANCFQTHNTCVKSDSCPKSLNIGRKGCPEGTSCCVLIH